MISRRIYNILRDYIYHIESQCEEIEKYIVDKEADKMKTRLSDLHYPKHSIDQAVREFYQYFGLYYDKM